VIPLSWFDRHVVMPALLAVILVGEVCEGVAHRVRMRQW
jgi:hypothetical protein